MTLAIDVWEVLSYVLIAVVLAPLALAVGFLSIAVVLGAWERVANRNKEALQLTGLLLVVIAAAPISLGVATYRTDNKS